MEALARQVLADVEGVVGVVYVNQRGAFRSFGGNENVKSDHCSVALNSGRVADQAGKMSLGPVRRVYSWWGNERIVYHHFGENKSIAVIGDGNLALGYLRTVYANVLEEAIK